MFKMKKDRIQGSIGMSGIHMKIQCWQKNIILETLLCHVFVTFFQQSGSSSLF